MEDKTIVCVDCQQPFVFTGGEQQFYAERGLLELPKRCKPCRGQRRRRLSRRRKGGAERAEVGASLDTVSGAADTVGEAAPPAGPSKEPKEKAAPAGPRTFWDERPEWVRQAMLKAAPAPVAAGAPSPANGTNGGNGATARGSAVGSTDEGETGAEATGDGKRRRRRSRRRRRRGGDEGGRSREDARSGASSSSPAPGTVGEPV